MTLLVGQTLWVTNRATDADVPANGLSYQLIAAPAGAAIWLVANIQKLQIPHSRLGRQYRFRLTELDGWIRNHFDSNEEGVLNV